MCIAHPRCNDEWVWKRFGEMWLNVSIPVPLGYVIPLTSNIASGELGQNACGLKSVVILNCPVTVKISSISVDENT